MRKPAAFLALVLFIAMHTLRAQNIPTPKQHFGFNIGDDYQLATYSQTEAYFRSWPQPPTGSAW